MGRVMGTLRAGIRRHVGLDHEGSAQPRRRPLGGGESALSATAYVLTVVTVLTLALPWLSFATIAPGTDLVLEAVATTIAGFVALLAWIRFREAGQAHELFQASAFLALAAGGVIAMVLALSGAGDSLRGGRVQASQASFYLWDLGRLTAGLLFVAGGWFGSRDEARVVRRPTMVLLAPTGVLVVLSALILGRMDDLPPIRSDELIGTW